MSVEEIPVQELEVIDKPSLESELNQVEDLPLQELEVIDKPSLESELNQVEDLPLQELEVIEEVILEEKPNTVKLWDFKSEIFQITLGGADTFALGWVDYDPVKNPPIIQGFLVNVKAIYGYQAGNLVSPTRGVSYQISEDRLVVRFASNGIFLVRRDRGRLARISPRRWKFLITAIAL